MKFTWALKASLLAGAVILALTLIWSVGIEPGLLLVKPYTLSIANWPTELNGLKLAIITDLHAGAWQIDAAKIKAVVSKTNEQHPDLILLLGDFVSSQKNTKSVKQFDFAQYLGSLKSNLGVYSILGNHDWWSDGELIRRQLEQAHITVLENSSTKVRFHGKFIWLVGLADLWTRKPKFDDLISQIPAEDTVLVLTHNPDIFPKIPLRVALTLAGHTHGGQVAIPLIGPIILPSKYGNRFAKGHIIENGKHLFVSSGIGTSIFPIRFLVPPEISILNIYAQNPLGR